MKSLRSSVWNLIVKKNKNHRNKSDKSDDVIEVDYRDQMKSNLTTFAVEVKEVVQG